jgi:DNA polymerase-3 subunit delta'
MPTLPASPSTPAWPVFGHDWAVRMLQRTLDPTGDGPRHAYLFLGSPQLGKTTLARAFAQALLCTAQAKPCGSCRACQLMARGSHPDFRLVQPTDRDGKVDRTNGMLRSEQAAEIIHEAVLRPVEARYKIFVIQDAHTAHDSFSNKLLKTLEEPPDHVILCLTALARTGLLPTILSRCQVIKLSPLTVQTVEAALMAGWQAEPAQAALLSRLSNGRLGWAVAQLGDPEAATHRQTQLAQLWQLVAADQIERLEFAEKLAAGRDNEKLFPMLDLWETWWRDVLLAQSGCLDACSHIDQRDEIMRQAEAIAAAQVRSFLHTLPRVSGYLHHTVQTRMALDVLLLRLPTMARAAV